MNTIDIYRDLPLNRPLTDVAKQGTMSVLLGNVEGRNGQFRNGGHCQSSRVDTHQTQTPEPRLSVCVKAQKRKNGRALCGATQQSGSNDFRTVQSSPTEENSFVVVVLPVASGRVSSQAVKPRCLPRRSIESRPAHCMSYGNIWQGDEQGRVEGDSMLISTLLILSYFLTLATNALLDRHYAQWQEGRK